MSFLDKVKSGFDKAKEGVSDFAETTKLRLEINKLNDRKTALFNDIGRQVHALRAQGRGLAEVESQSVEVDGIDQEIKRINDEIAKINAEPGTEPPKTV
jgi:archaellum component FlaC